MDPHQVMLVNRSEQKPIPAGSASLAIYSASEVAKSEFAGLTANMIQVSCSI